MVQPVRDWPLAGLFLFVSKMARAPGWPNKLIESPFSFLTYTSWPGSLICCRSSGGCKKEEGSFETHYNPPLSTTRQASQCRTLNIGGTFNSCPTQALWAGRVRYTPMQFHTDSFLLHKPLYCWYMLTALQCSYPVSMLTIKTLLCKCTIFLVK